MPPKKFTIRRLLTLFAPHKRETFIMLSTVMGGVLLGLIAPFLLREIIDKGLQQNDMKIIAEYSVLSIIVTIAASVVTLLYGYQSVQIGQKIMCELRYRFFTHLMGMSLRFFTSTRTGEIQTRLVSDLEGVQNVLSNSLVDALSNVAIVASCFIAMVAIDWRLSILAVCFVPFILLAGGKAGSFAAKVRLGLQKQTAEVNSMTQENLSVSGAMLSKTIGRADEVARAFDIENKKLAGWNIKSSVQQYIFFGLFRTITQILPVCVYWYAGWLIFKGKGSLTVGALVAFTMLQARMFFPLTGLLGLYYEILKSFALFDRIYEYIDMEADVQDRPDARAMPSSGVRGDVEFRNVGFKYDQSGDDWTLKGVSFSAKPGQLVAIVGPSGAGKTTLTYLIPRLYDVDAGSILIDGIDIRDVKLADLQRAVGMVSQETYLIHTTIRENLKIADPDATEEQMVEACKAAAIHDHIASLTEGYDTVVGERGYKLSGGEKQRLAIARAILKNPRILILDEATSALDTISERLIQASLNKLMNGRTTFAIAHRLSTIENADVILVVKDGRIVEAGTHAELSRTGGEYSKLRAVQHGQLVA